MCFAEHGFLLDLARARLLPSAGPSCEETRNSVCSAHGMCITFSLSRQAENVSQEGEHKKNMNANRTFDGS